MCGSLWVHLVWNSLWPLDLDLCFLPQLKKVFCHYFFKYSLYSFLSSPSGTPIVWMFECLMLSQRSLKLSSFLKIIFSFCYSNWLSSTSLSSRPLICSSVLANLLLIPINVFLFQLLYFSGTLGSFLHFFFLFLFCWLTYFVF